MSKAVESIALSLPQSGDLRERISDKGRSALSKLEMQASQASALVARAKEHAKKLEREIAEDSRVKELAILKKQIKMAQAKIDENALKCATIYEFELDGVAGKTLFDKMKTLNQGV